MRKFTRGLVQNKFWKATTTNGLASILADTASRVVLQSGSGLMPSAEAPERFTIRRLLLWLNIVNGGTQNIIHLGVIAQNGNESVLSPRTGAGDDRWMWWTALYLGASLVVPNANSSLRDQLVDIKSQRIIGPEDNVYLAVEGTEAFDMVYNARMLIGGGLKRRSR